MGDQNQWASQSATVQWQVTEGAPKPLCNKGLNLNNLISPYRGDAHTSGVTNAHTLSCPGDLVGNEQLFFYILRPKMSISISPTGGQYDFSHELRVGGDCPGVQSIACSNRPSSKAAQYYNTGDTAVAVYYIID